MQTISGRFLQEKIRPVGESESRWYLDRVQTHKAGEMNGLQLGSPVGGR